MSQIARPAAVNVGDVHAIGLDYIVRREHAKAARARQLSHHAAPGRPPDVIRRMVSRQVRPASATGPAAPKWGMLVGVVFDRWVPLEHADCELFRFASLNCSPRLSAHQRPAGLLKVRHHVASASLAVASLRHHPLLDLATIDPPAVEGHDIFFLPDKLHIGIRADFCRRYDEQQTSINASIGVSITTQASEEFRRRRTSGPVARRPWSPPHRMRRLRSEDSATRKAERGHVNRAKPCASHHAAAHRGAGLWTARWTSDQQSRMVRQAFDF